MTAPRRASATYKGRIIDVAVDLLNDHHHSHIVVTVRGGPDRRQPLLAEYVTDHAEFEAALNAGVGIAQQIIDAQPRRRIGSPEQASERY